MIKNIKYCVLLMSVIFITGTGSAVSKSISANLRNEYQITDACNGSEKREILLLLDLGRVEQSDSLYGITVEIKYDTAKIKLENIITQNTLAEGFKYQYFLPSKEEGIVRLIVGDIDPDLPPAFGNKPALGLFCSWISECEDSAEFSINYIEFTSEFKNTVDTLNSVVVYTKDLKDAARKIEFTLSKDSLVFDDNTVQQALSVNMKSALNTKTELIKIKIQKPDPTKAEIVNIQATDDRFEITDKNEDENNIYISAQTNAFIDNGKILDFEVKNNAIDTTETDLVINAEILNSCNCVSEIIGDNIQIVNYYVNNTSVNDETGSNIKAYYSSSADCFIISSDMIINRTTVYSIMGVLLDDKKTNSEIMRIDTQNYTKGVYILCVETQQGEIIKIKLIKN